ncbi:guanine-1-methyltransferase-domain-containing protein [Scleroderma citrinum]
MDTSAADSARTEQEEQATHPQGLSKKAQKRAAKAVRLHELKLERRAREKETRKRKRRERAQAIANGECDANIACKRRRINNEGDESATFKARIIVDLGFDELMTDKVSPSLATHVFPHVVMVMAASQEINSLTSQLAYTYSANRRAPYPFSSLLFTSLNGRTKQRLDAMNDAGYRRWSNTEWWEDGYERMWTRSSPSLSEQPPNEPISVPTNSNGSTPTPNTGDPRESIVYFTADSENEILELQEGKTYVIGGICDHNRHKNLCLNKANAAHIAHGRLPIGRYIALATRKVLTVNQVFEILLKWVETRNWEEAFWAVIPKRKFQGVERVRGKDDGINNEEVNYEDGRGDVADQEGLDELVMYDSRGDGNGVSNDSEIAEA